MLFSEIVSAYNKTLDIIDKYGLNKIIEIVSIVLIMIIGNGLLNEFQFPKLLVNYQNEQMSQHENASNERAEIDPIIQQTLLQQIVNLKCDRAFILEMHNGNNNPTGLPFRYCEMNYEEISDSVEEVSDQYRQINMSRYPLFSYLNDKHVLLCSIDDLCKIDKKFAKQMKNDGIKYVAFKVLMANTTPIGILGFSFCKNVNLSDKMKEKIYSSLIMSGDKFSDLLDKKKASEPTLFNKIF